MASIQVQDVTKAYGLKKLFQEVTVTFNAGRRYGVTGPNGAGKSTFLKIVSGDIEPDNGTVQRPKRTSVLKQDQFAPVPVEEQIAIITASTRGFLDRVPVNRVKQFEKEYLELMRGSHQHVLDNLRAGKFEDADVETMKKVATDLAKQYA